MQLQPRLALPASFAVMISVVPLLLTHVTPKLCSTAPKLLAHTVTTTMSTPNATSWIQSHLMALHADVGVQDAFDRAFAPGCEVRLNHDVYSPQALKDDLAARRAAATDVSVAWNADVISTNDDNPEQPAVVAGTFVVTRSLPFRIRVSPAQRLTHIHFSAKIEQDASVQDGDRRRITSFHCVAVDSTPPIHFAVPHAAQEGSDSQ